MIKPSLAIVLLTAACGGGGAKPDTTTVTANTGGEAPAADLAPGTSGFPGVDWGDSRADIQADHPGAAVDGDGLTLTAMQAGEDAVIDFTFSIDSLVAIRVAYAATFASMAECADTYHEVRAELATSLGETGDDNLSSWWSTGTAEIQLACNPEGEDGEPATMFMSYALPE